MTPDRISDIKSGTLVTAKIVRSNLGFEFFCVFSLIGEKHWGETMEWWILLYARACLAAINAAVSALFFP